MNDFQNLCGMLTKCSIKFETEQNCVITYGGDDTEICYYFNVHGDLLSIKLIHSRKTEYIKKVR